MAILIPLAIIFLAFSYLQLNEEVSNFEYIVVYTIIVFTIFISLFTYRRLKQNLKQQEINQIILEIKELEKKLLDEKDEKKKTFFINKIEKLKQECESKI